MENQFLTLKKSNMSIDEYTNAFIDKIEFALCIIPDKLATIDMYEKGLPWEYSVLVHKAPTLEATI